LAGVDLLRLKSLNHLNKAQKLKAINGINENEIMREFGSILDAITELSI
jgi:hypothetical protein